MRRVGQSRKRDANEPAIVDALEAVGLVVHRLSSPGLPDLLVFNPRAVQTPSLTLLEVKVPGGKLTTQQQTTRERMPFAIVESVADALSLFGVNG